MDRILCRIFGCEMEDFQGGCRRCGTWIYDWGFIPREAAWLNPWYRLAGGCAAIDAGSIIGATCARSVWCLRRRIAARMSVMMIGYRFEEGNYDKRRGSIVEHNGLF